MLICGGGGYPNLSSPVKFSNAFTLAEVLITLGVIGIVAALTIPNVTSLYRKNIAETRLAKFYSVMNQAIQRSEVDNGPKEYWASMASGHGDESDEAVASGTKIMPEDWYNKYLKPYIQSTNVKINDKTNKVMVYFSDGGLCLIGGASFQFWPQGSDFENYGEDDSGNATNNYELSGIKYFTFFFAPADNSDANKYHFKKGVEPYKRNWDGTIEKLKNDSAIGCSKTVSNERAYCTPLIQINGWKVPDDYPVKF